jgi:uncharacterized protein YdeI (YjbR/CyaY-like superfamily)
MGIAFVGTLIQFVSLITTTTTINMKMAPSNSVQVLTRGEWRSWLMNNHRQPNGIWLITYKKATGIGSIEYSDIVDEALCFGWIDSKANKLDDERKMQWMTTRKPKSGWSKVNKGKIEQLIESGLMMPAGYTKIEAAQLDGSWSLLDSIENLELPTDLVDALALYPNATKHFNAFPRSSKRIILHWIQMAKKDDTRKKRVDETARCAEDNIRANQ